MPNIAALLKSEISRISRKEIRSESDSLKKASGAFRRDIAELKRRVATLERILLKLSDPLEKKSPSPRVDDGTRDDNGAKRRFVPKGMKSMRSKFGLSQSELALILDVSTQSIVKWENGTAYPRALTLDKIVQLRGASKKQIQEYLAHRRGLT